MSAPVLLIGHRGSSSHQPENTLRSFHAAFDEGAQMVELDLRLSADGVPVVFHDPDLRRLAGRDSRAEEETAATLAGLPVLADRHAPGEDTTIPSLERVLAEVGGRGPLYLELKYDGGDDRHNARLLAACLELVGEDSAHLLASFDPGLVAQALQAGRRAAIILDHPAKLEGLRPAQQDALVAWSLRHRHLDATFAARAHRAQVALWCWTVDDPADLDRVLEHRVQGICSNDVAAMRALLDARGLRPPELPV